MAYRLYYFKAITIFLIIFATFSICFASNGDRTQFFNNCRENCERQNCTADGIEMQEQAIKYYRQSFFDKLFRWTCSDECEYGCMWRTVFAFFERGWPIPQFYGRWPFIRIFGLQEPAAVLFSVLNFWIHCRMLRKLRREVRKDSPCFILYHVLPIASLNGWVWSAIFHARDLPWTELLDYAFAYSIVLCLFYVMVMRVLYRHSLFLRGVITLACISFYLNYFAYLSVGSFDYSFNMKVNLITGLLSTLGWLTWCYKERKDRPYYVYLLRFQACLILSMTLELLDFPPILWILDAHALWHLSTVPLSPLLYNFFIEDCKTLRKELELTRVYYDR